MATTRKACKNCTNDLWTKEYVWSDELETLEYKWRCTNCSNTNEITTRKPKLEANGLTASQNRVIDRIKQHIAGLDHWSLSDPEVIGQKTLAWLSSNRWYDAHISINIGLRGAATMTIRNTLGENKTSLDHLDVYVR